MPMSKKIKIYLQEVVKIDRIGPSDKGKNVVIGASNANKTRKKKSTDSKEVIGTSDQGKSRKRKLTHSREAINTSNTSKSIKRTPMDLKKKSVDPNSLKRPW